MFAIDIIGIKKKDPKCKYGAWGCDVRSVIRFQNHRRCYKHTVTHFNGSIMTQVRYKALLIR